MACYRAIFTRDPDGAWLVDVPELEGCHTFGKTLEDARAHVRDAVSLWLESDDFELEEIVRE